LSAVPRIDGRGLERIRLEGDLPSSANPPQGCHFAPRCTHVTEQCRQAYPPTAKSASSHSVNCYLFVDDIG
jgi:peptide/nickel transport system ATP-binding protein